MKREDCYAWTIIGVFALAVAALVAIVVYLAVRDPLRASFFIKNHLYPLFIGLGFSALFMVFFHRYLSWRLQLVFLIIPPVLAAAWPDLVFFIAYVIRNGSVVDVLWQRNEVYAIMNQYVTALSAAPVIVGLLMWFERKVSPLPAKMWSYPLIMLVVTALVSMANVFLDVRFGF